jgi:hypothetical protein
LTARGMPGDVPRISVVVAPIHSGAALSGALAALDAQVGAPAFEVIVPVDASVAGLGALKARFPSVRFIDVEGTAALAKSDHMGVKHEAIDRRRAAGLAATRAPIIALTEEHARPDPDWCARLAALHADLPHAVIGGAIENANGRVINHALFLADAGRYQNPLPPGPAAFVSDTNVSYKRAALFAIADVWSELYNETRVHDTLRQRGHTTWLSPEPVVRIDRGPITAAYALHEAFAWSRLYAGRRTRAAAIDARLVLALASPLLAPVLLLRQAKVARTRGRLGPFIRCLPFLVLVDLARTAGEWVGYVTGREAPLRADHPTP